MNITEEQFQEALNLLQEECAEVIQAISKLRRFGPNSVSPYPSDNGKTNIQLLTDEIGDVKTLINYLSCSEAISYVDIYMRIEYKRDKLKRYSSLYAKLH